MRKMGRQLIGSTSWLVPGTYYENARLVAQLVDFVELLVYTWDLDTFNLFEKEIGKLRALSENYGLKYSIHLPTDDLKNVRSVLSYFDSKLPVINYVLHPYDGDGFYDLLNGNFGEQISVENLKEKFVNFKRTVFDIGHHLLGVKVDGVFLSNVVELHVMGVENGKDHRKLNMETLEEMYSIFGNRMYEIEYVCFEIFDLNDLIESLKLWNVFKKVKLYA